MDIAARQFPSSTKSALIKRVYCLVSECGYDGEMTSAKDEKSESSSSSDEDEESLRELVSCSHQHLYMNFSSFTVIDCGLISVRFCS